MVKIKSNQIKSGQEEATKELKKLRDDSDLDRELTREIAAKSLRELDAEETKLRKAEADMECKFKNLATQMEDRERNAKSYQPLRQKGFYTGTGFMPLTSDYEKKMRKQFKDFQVWHVQHTALGMM